MGLLTIPKCEYSVTSQEKKQLSSPVESLARPLLLCMSIFGIYIPYIDHPTKICLRIFFKAYSCLTIGILCYGIYNTIFVDSTIFVVIGTEFAAVLQNVLYYTTNIFNAIVLDVMSYRKNGLNSLLKSWYFAQGHEGSSNIEHDTRFRKAVFVSLAVAGLCAVVSLALTVFFFVWNVNQNSTFKEVIFTLWFIVVEIYHISGYALTPTLAFVVSFAINIEFSLLRKEFKKDISPDGTFLGDLGLYRKRHQQICKRAEKVDDIFCPVLGCCLFMNTFMGLLTLYIIAWDPEVGSNTGQLFMLIYWLFLAITVLVVICVCGELISNTTHHLLSDLYDVDVSKYPKNATEVQVFLSRLTCEGIGLTAMKMFFINKTTILTLFGLLVTYYLVLLQFQYANNPCDQCCRNYTATT